MYRRLTLPLVFLLLGYGFWVSPTFKDIAAGVAVFLFGMLCMEQGFKAFTDGTLEGLIRKSTDRTWTSLTFGVVTTTLMQSSSLVSVIMISFLSAGLLGLAEGIGIIFGANLGTTTGAWIVAGFGLKVKLSMYAMPMLVFGVLMLFQKSRAIKGGGWILVGLGFLFLGIHFMFNNAFSIIAHGICLRRREINSDRDLIDLLHYSQSSNLFIRKEYNRMRIEVGELLRDLSVLREEEPGAVAILSLDAVKVHVADSLRFAHETVDGLIRDASISPQMATSLMNDSRYVNEIMMHLLSMADGLVGALGVADEQAAEIALTPEEVEAMVADLHDDNPVTGRLEAMR